MSDIPEDEGASQAKSERRLDGQPRPTVDSQRLFDGHRELIIQHQGEFYRLRITRHDKLILTK
ncbi:MAG: hemin uptake protein HemP [Burkholderiales bacterium]|nr:MAG: hemin uptake protein HemP [Burkholderiales bacterium]